MDDPQTAKQEEARRCTEAMRNLFLHFRARFEEELRGTGVTLPQLRMLKSIEQQNEASAAAIARMCGVTPQTLHAMLTRAFREGRIVRGTPDPNHRFVTAALTSKGRAIVGSGMALRERMEGELWNDVSTAGLKNFREILERGLANLARHGGEPDEVSRHPKR